MQSLFVSSVQIRLSLLKPRNTFLHFLLGFFLFVLKLHMDITAVENKTEQLEIYFLSDLEQKFCSHLPWRAWNLLSFGQVKDLSRIRDLFCRSFSMSSKPSGPSSSNNYKENKVISHILMYINF